MKKFILLSAAIVLFSFNIFSQSGNRMFSLDTTQRSITIPDFSGNFIPGQPQDFNYLLSDSIKSENKFFPEYLEKKYNLGSYFGNIKPLPYDNMPCYVPQGLHAMRVLVPDTTAYFPMQIKRY